MILLSRINAFIAVSYTHLNLPGIGSVNAEVATNSLGIQDVIDVFDSDGEFYNNDKFYNRLKGPPWSMSSSNEHEARGTAHSHGSSHNIALYICCFILFITSVFFR